LENPSRRPAVPVHEHADRLDEVLGEIGFAGEAETSSDAMTSVFEIRARRPLRAILGSTLV